MSNYCEETWFSLSQRFTTIASADDPPDNHDSAALDGSPIVSVLEVPSPNTETRLHPSHGVDLTKRCSGMAMTQSIDKILPYFAVARSDVTPGGHTNTCSLNVPEVEAAIR